MLLEAGADANLAANDGATPLIHAARAGDLELARLLLAAGADPNARTERVGSEGQKQTALMVAVEARNLPLTEALLAAGADPEVVDEAGRTALDLATEKGDGDLVRRLREAGAAGAVDQHLFHNAALRKAAAAGHLDQVRAMLQAGADVNSANDLGQTALILGADGGHTAVVRELLTAGADANAGTWHHTALRLAVVRGFSEIALYLIAARADVNRRYSSFSVPAGEGKAFPTGELVLLDAICYGREEVVAALLRAGADVNAADSSGLTALFYAARTRQYALAQSFIDAGAVVDERVGDFLKPRDFARAARAPEFQQSIRELTELCQTNPEPIVWLPGAVSFRVVPPGAGRKIEFSEATAAEWGKEWAQTHETLQRRMDAILESMRPRCMERGQLTLDLGMPRGCGPDVRFLGLVPTSDKYAVIAAVGTSGNEAGLSTPDIIAWLRGLEKEQPFLLCGCQFDVVDIMFTEPVGDPQGLAERMYAFCPDLVDQGAGSTAALAVNLRATGRVHFWWD
jgi:ankyrin repeat protein